MKNNDDTNLSPVTRAIEAAIRDIPSGMISTYGRVAQCAGVANGARQVVRVLHSRAEAAGLPWYRVLAKGKLRLTARIALCSDGFDEQRALLLAEGVAVDDDGTVDFSIFGYPREDRLET